MIKTSGIVLSGIKFRESSKILTVYTRELGKIKVMGQGVMKPKSEGIASTEVFAHSEFDLKKGRNFYYINSVYLIDSYHNLRNSMDTLFLGFYILELMDKTIHEEEHNPILFDLLNKALIAIKNGEEPLLIAVAFQLKFVSFMGYRPQLDICSSCGNTNSQIWRFSSSKGGVFCEDCFTNEATTITEEQRLTLTKILLTPFDNLRSLNIKKENIWKIYNLMLNYISYNFDIKELKSQAMIRNGITSDNHIT